MTTNEETPATAAEDVYAERVVRIACAYFAHNQVPIGEIGNLIATITAALVGAPPSAAKGVASEPAVSIKKSIGDDFIICLEDGKKLTMLKRYLRAQYDMSPEEYRAKWNLPHDYPMVAPAYARLRSAFAKKIGLGRVETRKKKA